MTVGALANRANVSVRTLQYYDKFGLLKPSGISEGGRRLYCASDLAVLHQIITLKEIGLSLEEIKLRLIPANSTADIKRMLLLQADFIKEQIAKATNVLESIEMIAAEIDLTEAVDWSKYSNMLQLIQKSNESYWVVNYLDKEMLENVAQVHERYTEAELPSDWLVRCMKRAKGLLDTGGTPDGDEAQALAAEIWAIVEKYSQGKPEMTQTMYAFFKDAKQWPAQYAQLHSATHKFLETAIEHHIRRLK